MSTAQLLTPNSKRRTVRLARDHAASNHGLPVLLVDDAPIGPAETGGVLVVDDPVEAGRAEAAGYRVAMSLGEAHELLQAPHDDARIHGAKM